MCISTAVKAQPAATSAAALELLIGPGTPDTLAPRTAADDRRDPLWPYRTFLRAEALDAQGRKAEAAAHHLQIVDFAASDPYRDTWGGHGLSAFALYRWLQWHAAGGADAAAFKRVADLADALMPTRLGRAAFRPHATLVSLPRLEEQLLLALARQARKTGDPSRAGGYLLDYLSRTRTPDDLPKDDPLYATALRQGLATPDRLSLLRGKRLLELGREDDARGLLGQAMSSTDLQVQLDAKFHFVRASPRIDRQVRLGYYEEVARYATADALAQAALIQAGLLFPPEEPEFARYLTQAVDSYGSAPGSDEALDWLAWGARVAGRLDDGVGWLERLQELRPSSRRLADLSIETALALVWRDKAGDLDRAEKLLQHLLRLQPHADDAPAAYFWLGRLAEQRGRIDEARKHFQAAAAADSHGYHGLRARMHLAEGAKARRALAISQPGLRAELRRDHAAPLPAMPTDVNGYTRRLTAAMESGLYRAVLEAETALRRAEPATRVQEMRFEDLDRSGHLAAMATLIALRQDLFAAVDTDGRSDTRLALAARLSQAAADWPALLSLVHPVLLKPTSRRAQTLATPSYLRVAYPAVYRDLVRAAAARYDVAPSLLYAIMREESFFYQAALSSAGALGLFQFIPPTFNALDKSWGLLGPATAPDRASYLMDEALAIDLGARWFSVELAAFKRDPLMAPLAHLHSPRVVQRWQDKVWKPRGWDDDAEMRLASFRRHDLLREGTVAGGRASRDFARHVLTNIMLVDALGLYDEVPIGPR